MQGLTFIKSRGKVIPEDHLKKMIEAYPSAVGVALVNDGQLVISDNNEMVKPDIDDLLKTLNGELKDFSVLLYFANFPDGTPADMVQPFCVLENEGGNAVVAAAIEGKMVDFKDEGDETAEFQLARDDIGPALADLYTISDNTLDVLFDKLGEDRHKKAFTRMLEIGTITLLGANGRFSTISKSELVASYDYGWASNNLGVMGTGVIVDAPKTGILGSLGLGRRAKAVDNPPTPGDEAKPLTAEPVKEQEPAHKQVPSTPKSTAAHRSSVREAYKPPAADTAIVEPKEVITYKFPPSKIESGNKLKSWYHRELGFLPKKDLHGFDWNERPGIPVRNDKVVKDFKDLPMILSLKDLPPQLVANKDAPKVEEQPKKVDEKPLNPPMPVQKPPVPEPSQPVPVIPAEHKEKLQNNMANELLQVMDLSNLKMPDPQTIQNMEDKWPAFADQMGLPGLEATFGWSYATLEKMGNLSVPALATYAFNLRRFYLNLLAQAPDGVLQPEVKEAVQQATPTARRVPSVPRRNAA